MASFGKAIPVVFHHEGYFSDDPDDRGKATKYGISLAFLEDLLDSDGDGYLDGDLNHDGLIDVKDIHLLTIDLARDLYREHFWNRYGYENLKHQSIATKVFDLCVNMGPRRSAKLFQRAIASHTPEIKIDGILGPNTLRLANQIFPSHLLPEIKHEAAATYRAFNRPKYISGWLNRAYS